MRLTRGNLRPLRQLYPCQVGTQVEQALPSYHPMIVAALLYPLGEVTEPIQLHACGGIEMFFYVGHILEGVVFLDVSPLLLALGEVVKELFLQGSPLHLLEGGVIVLIVGFEDRSKVLLPSGAPIFTDILKRVFR